jgi:hypothetical protein
MARKTGCKYLAFLLLVYSLSLAGCSIFDQTASQSNQIYLGRSRIEVMNISNRVIGVDGRRYDLDRTIDEYTCKRSSEDKQLMYCDGRGVTKECYCVMVQ